jgi:hypothetical protein
MPVRTRRKVDLPAPLAPIIDTASPSPTLMLKRLEVPVEHLNVVNFQQRHLPGPFLFFQFAKNEMQNRGGSILFPTRRMT